MTLFLIIAVVLVGVIVMLTMIKGRIDRIQKRRDSQDDEGLPGAETIRAAFRSFGRN